MILLYFFLFYRQLLQIESIRFSTKHWISTCEANKCLDTLKSCLTCQGEIPCKECIKSKLECSNCAEDIYNKDCLESINGEDYLTCDLNNPLKETVCHLSCRGKYYNTGKCDRIENIPVCICTSGFELSNNTITNLIDSFNGQVKLTIAVNDGFFKIFQLPNGDLLRGSNGPNVQIWDTQRGTVKGTLYSAYYKPVVFGVLSNHEIIIGYASNRTFIVWDINGQQIKRIIQVTESLQCLTILKNNELAIGQYGLNYDIVIKDSINGFTKKRLVGHKSTVYQILELPNSKLASCSSDDTVRLWDSNNGILLRTLVHTSTVYSINLLKNGNLISGLYENIIQVWNLNTGDKISNLIGHSNLICNYECLSVLENGDLLSASYDKTIQRWNPYDGKNKLILNKHNSKIKQMSLSNNGRLISASDTEIIIWS